MRPQDKIDSTHDLFRKELTQMINLAHPLCVMAKRINSEKANEIVLSWFDSTVGRPAKSLSRISGNRNLNLSGFYSPPLAA